MVYTNSKGSDQTAWMGRLVLDFAVGICSKKPFWVPKFMLRYQNKVV